MNKPQRTFEVSIKIGADEWDGVIQQLEYLVTHMASHGPGCNSLSGGPTSNHTVDVSHQPDMTHTRYHVELAAYLDEIKKKSGDR